MIAPVFIFRSRANSVCLPISIWKQNGKIVRANALINSRATGCFISKETVQKVGLPIQKLNQTVRAWNVDGTWNKLGMVKYKTNIVLNYGRVKEHCDLFICNYRKDKVILGLPWLWAINLEINWTDGRVTIALSNYRWTIGEPPKILEQQYLLQYMLYNEAAHIKDELYDTFKTWTSEQHAKFFNASGWLHSRICHQMDNDINNHRSRSNQGEDHLASGLQRIWGCILWENSCEITTLLILWPCHWTQKLVHTLTGQVLPTKPHWTSILQRVCQRTPQNRKNYSFQIPSSHIIFLC